MSRFLTLDLLRLVSWPHLAAHRVRTALTVLGVALGVATVVGIADVSESVVASFQQMVRTVAGDAELEVTPLVGTLDEATVALAAAVPGVEAAAGIIETFVPLEGRADETLLLLGIDFLGSPVWQSQFPRAALDLPDELIFMSQPDSVLLSRRFAERAGIDLGATIRVVAPGGPRTLHVRGLLGEAPVAHLFDGAIAVMDLPAAELLLGRERRVDRVAVQLVAGASPEAVRGALPAALGPGVEVAAAEGRGEQAEKLLLSLRTLLACMSLGAVIVGAFIVYHTVAVSVQQRRRTFALLDAVGIGRRALVRLCLVETLVLAALGVFVGLVAGHRLAAAMTGVVGETASEIWLRVQATERASSVWGSVNAIGMGIGIALLAAVLAVRSTFRASTIEALQPAHLTPDEPGALAKPVVAAVLLLAGTGLTLLVPPGLGFASLVAVIEAMQAAAFAAAALLAPVVVKAVGTLLRRLVSGTLSVPARLAAENLPRAPRRGGATVATIAAATGIAIMLACLVRSHEVAWLDWLEQRFSADLIVGSGARIRLRAGPPMGEEVAATIAGIGGVASVEPFRVIPIELDGRPAFLEGVSVPDRLAHGGLAMVEGEFAVAAPRLTAGTGVLLSDNLAYRLRLHAGDDIMVPTPDGIRRFRVEGTFVDYMGSLDLGAVLVARTQLATVWHDRLANLLRVWLEPGVAPSVVRGAILERLGPGAGYYVLTGRDFLDAVRTVVNGFFAAAWVLVLVAAVVGVVGIVNAQVATVLDRSREIATLRTIGVARRDLTRSVLLECGVLGALGGLGGVVVGTFLGAQIVLVALRLVTGYRMALVVPTAPLLAAVALAGLLSAVAGWVPARAAMRVETALRSLD